MTEFGELVLVLGDLHIPHRASAIPEKFQRMLVPHKMQHVLCTGNVGNAASLEDLKRLAPNVHVVRGDMDETGPAANFPEHKVVTIGDFRIGLCHGHQAVPWGDPQALAMLQRQLDVDILVTGHTHRNEVLELPGDGKWLINPGSITGAYGGLAVSGGPEGEEDQVVPSFVLLAVQGSKVVTYVYEEKNGQVDVSKIEFAKGVSGSTMSSTTAAAAASATTTTTTAS